MSPRYEICVKGHLDTNWSTWFDDLTLQQRQNGVTVLIGPLPDQAALYGLLIKIRDLGLPLLAVNRLES